jgi:uncharacterized protein
VFIEIEDLKDEALRVQHEYAAGTLHLAHADVALGETVRTDFTLTHKEQDLHVGGRIETGIRFRCSRCLKECAMPLAARFDLFYLPQPKGLKEKEEIALRYEDMDIAYYDGIRLDVDLMVLEQIELAMPMKFVCREDCQGLCSNCGADLNERPCGCTPDTSDSRLAVLLQFRKKMEQ